MAPNEPRVPADAINAFVTRAFVAVGIPGHDAATLAGLITEAQMDPAFAVEYRTRFVEPRRGQGREVFRRAIERGEIPADTKIEVAPDMLYGPLYPRLLHGHAPLDDRFVRDVVDAALDGIMPGRPPGP